MSYFDNAITLRINLLQSWFCPVLLTHYNFLPIQILALGVVIKSSITWYSNEHFHTMPIHKFNTCSSLLPLP